MSGDVQPRKRKDKKKKKDDIGFEEPKGTAAALGDGDLFLHSHHDHGTGGHWCAKIIFFSLLAVLVTLIGLIILENRGLTELEANSVQTQYSGVLEGWLEEVPDDDHHDEHTLELNHPDDNQHDDEDNQDLVNDDNEDKDEQENIFYLNNESEEDEEDNEEDDDNYDENSDLGNEENDYNEEDGSDNEEEDRENEEDENEENNDTDEENGDDNEEDDNQTKEEDDDANRRESTEFDDDNDKGDNIEENDIFGTGTTESYDDDEYNEKESAEYQKYNNYEEEHDDHDEDEEQDEEVEVEHIEEEPSDLEPISTELPALPEEDDDDDKNDSKQDDDDEDENDVEDDDAADENDFEYLEPPVVEHVSVPSGQPYVEFEDSKEELPVDTLAEEDEYEKRQEELRREEEESTSHIWLKLGVGAALLAATHAVMRRAAGPASNGNTEENEEESSSLSDRRMTLIPTDDEEETQTDPITSETTKKEVPTENIKRLPILIQTTRPTLEEEEEEEIETLIPEPTKIIDVQRKNEIKKEFNPDKEYYSDEDEEEEKKSEVKNKIDVITTNEDDDDEVLDDVEIIEDEQIDEEMEEEAEEEEISDVDDAELLSRLEAKYGRLPEPHRPEPAHKSGQSADDLWPDEPDDPYWREQLDQAEHQLNEDSLSALTAAAAIARSGSLRRSARARWVAARAVDRKAEILRDNAMLEDCIVAYLHVLDMSDHLSNKHLWMITNRTLDRMSFKGNYLRTEQVYRLLINRFPEEPVYRNNLTIAFLMSNRADKAVVVLKETLKLWPDDRVALAHYGFVQKTLYNQLEESVALFRRALEGDKGPAVEPRFYYHLGDALLLLGRKEEAHAVHERGAALGMFLSATQRSLYNVDRLKSSPWWDVHKSPYRKLAESLEKSWKEILVEGERARASYEQEKEGLRERGEWSQLDMFVRGREVSGRCARAPVTCRVVRSEPAAAGCRRGQVKFSSMAAGTHVRAHVGPTNCRLRLHLALSNTRHTYLRVGNETRQWEVGKVLMFDDSFEHEVWHNGTAPRLVLIVDVWHPDLTPSERRSLPAI